jgi:hypothetical protein
VRNFIIAEVNMEGRWKLIGLWSSLALEIFFWVSYLSLLLTKIGSPFADIIWLLGGALGILFGAINLIRCQRKIIKVLSFVTIVLGVIQLALWALAMFVTSM